MNFHPDWLVPAWRAPGTAAVMTTRHGGVSTAPFDSLNLRDGLGDDPAAVASNLGALQQALGVRPVWLNQVHGSRVLRLSAADALPGRQGQMRRQTDGTRRPPHEGNEEPSGASVLLHDADASVTTEPGVACAVQVADCLPVLFSAPDGRGVGAAHAGWRGLAAGVLEATVLALCEAAGCEPADLQAWMGASIGPRQFEVGADVLAAFGASAASADPARFIAHRPGKWLANLPQLARDRLQAAGLLQVSGGEWCTVEAPSRFFSFRRERVTGRMAAVIWRVPQFG